MLEDRAWKYQTHLVASMLPILATLPGLLMVRGTLSNFHKKCSEWVVKRYVGIQGKGYSCRKRRIKVREGGYNLERQRGMQMIRGAKPYNSRVSTPSLTMEFVHLVVLSITALHCSISSVRRHSRRRNSASSFLNSSSEVPSANPVVCNSFSFIINLRFSTLVLFLVLLAA
jgi:hypothetical protein